MLRWSEVLSLAATFWNSVVVCSELPLLAPMLCPIAPCLARVSGGIPGASLGIHTELSFSPSVCVRCGFGAAAGSC